MKEFAVVLSVSVKEGSTTHVRKMRVMIPAKDDVDAFEKAIKFGESRTEVKIVSIDETDFVVPLPEIKSDEERIEEMEKMTEEIDKLGSDFLKGKSHEEIKEKIPFLRRYLRNFNSLINVIEKL